MEEAKSLSDPISSLDQTDTSSVSQNKENLAKPTEKKKPFLIVVTILLVLIMGMSGYYVYKEYFEKNWKPEEIVEVDESDKEDEETNEEEETNDEDNVLDQEEEEYTLKNDGWALFSFPQYEFSVEISPYTMVQSEPYHEDDVLLYRDIYWWWIAQARNLEDSSVMASFYPDYLTTATVDFYPKAAEDMFGCGGGCAKEHYINVNIFKNEGSKSLIQVKDIFFANVMESAEEDNNALTIAQKEESKWGHKVITFAESDTSYMMEFNGHIIVNPRFVYIVSYFQSESPEESFDVSEKVIDSLEFGE